MTEMTRTDNRISTYTSGPDVDISRNITRAGFIRAIEELNEYWVKDDCLGDNMKWKAHKGHWEPEPISEGGIVLEGIDGYKSMRIFTRASKYPMVPNDVMTEWKNDETILYNIDRYDRKSPFYCWTCLKAFHGADPWTREEIALIRSVFVWYGMYFVYHTKNHIISKNQNPNIPVETNMKLAV